MRARNPIAALALCALAAALVAVPGVASAASPQPAWQLSALSVPTNLPPGGQGEVLVRALNVGAAPTDGTTVQFEDTLPAGLTPTAAGGEGLTCVLAPPVVSCTGTEPLPPGEALVLTIDVDVDPSAGPTAVNQAIVSGGGAASATPDSTQLAISSATPAFGFLPGSDGMGAPLGNPDGSPAALAGSHPYQLTATLAWPSRKASSNYLVTPGMVRDVYLELPPGELADPSATPVRCTEAQLATNAEGGCPPASQIGTVWILTGFVGAEPARIASDLFNMVPPPGKPSSFGFQEIGVPSHIFGALRSDSDYGLSGVSESVFAREANPIIAVQTQLWGDPSAPVHDAQRHGGAVPAGKTPLLSTAVRCPGSSLATRARADSWLAPGSFLESTPYQSADLAGNPVSLAGCNALSYGPSISSQPTTDAPDAPAGLEFTLTQPQETPHAEPLSGRATAELKDARVTLPAGLVANPSQAGGLAACTQAQIGYLGSGHYSRSPQSCPDASKLGTVEVASPLLAQYTEEGTKLATDPETGAPLPRPLHGSVFLAKPFENQFDSLLALYLAVEDEQSGIVAKLAGKIEPDPRTGRLTTVFEENPQLPLSDIHLRLFEGARAPLTTPLVCGAHTTTTDLTPWSDEEAGVPIEGADAHPEDSFQTAAGCSASEAAAPNAPSFEAGTQSPQAGAYSPFVLKLHREDGSQRLTGIDTTLAPGLTGKLAGIAECSDAQIAQAKAREHPNEGIAERESPSCPASSELGTVHVAAGSGPNPFWTSGHAYLAGPYKGAPLSLAVIVPALAGPFDLGTVVSRVALYVDPETAQIHAVSDPFPTILDGIPLDLRTVVLEMGRPEFTINPTSCNEMQILGSATSALGAIAPLAQRFQVGGCSALPFKPRLSLRLKGSVKRGSNPRLIASLTARPGEANIARAQVKLPHPVFLDQAHIKTICTRVQWAANTCPAGSIYGKVEADTPLLDYPLSGSVYLRSSNHSLPDLVAKLQGPAGQPIEIDLVGKTDAVHAALRNTFEAVPDAPVSSFRLELFGGKRGLIEMSSGFCRNRHATVDLTGQNGKVHDTRPVVRAKCPKGTKHRGHKHKRAGRG